MTTLSLPLRPFIQAQRFQLMTPRAFNPARNANHQRVVMGEPFWLCEVETTDLDAALSGEFKWMDADQQGRGATVYLYDAQRQRPLHGPVGDSPKIASVSRANRTLTLRDCTPGAVIAKGDYLSWLDGFAQRLHILGGGVVDGSGNLTVRCEPPPPATVTATLPVAVTFERPSAEFQILEFDQRFNAPTLGNVTLRASSIIRKF